MGQDSCTIVSKEIIAQGSEFPVMLLRFKTSETVPVNPALGQSLKLYSPKTGRKYSPVDVTSTGFTLGVKIYEGGKMSEYLRGVKVGQEMWWGAKPAWKSSKRRAPGGTNVGLIAMGIGITAVLPVLEEELLQGKSNNVVLLYSNRTTKDEIWVDEIKTLKEKYPNTFTFKRHLTREPELETDEAEGIVHTRLDDDVLKGYFSEWDPKESLFYAVGSKQQKKSVYNSLGNIGFDMDYCKLFLSDKKRKRSWFGC